MELDNNTRYDYPDEDYRTDGSQDQPPMTLAEVKEALSTYGANPEERKAPVFVTVDGVRFPLAGAEVDWTHAEGYVVLLHAEAD